MDQDVLKWFIFLAIVGALLLLDLGLFNRKDREISIKESLLMTAFYVSIGVCFGLGLWHFVGPQQGSEFLTGFVIEKTLSLDNIFVISLVFSSFAIPRHYQHRVLFWGILGVIVMRGIMIGAGAAIVQEFEWVMYLFAAFLIFTGAKMLIPGEDKEPNIQENILYRFMNKYFRVTKELHGNKFLVYQNVNHKQLLFCTPLFVALCIVEFVDLVFAVDSIPAIFSITTNTYVVYTSNIFAILGLRSLYFAMDAIIHRFAYLKYALAALLIFIGSKVFIAHFMLPESYGGKFPTAWSMGITFGLIALGVIVSLMKTKNSHQH
jgi:tellurite resistance protein TerC